MTFDFEAEAWKTAGYEETKQLLRRAYAAGRNAGLESAMHMLAQWEAELYDEPGTGPYAKAADAIRALIDKERSK